MVQVEWWSVAWLAIVRLWPGGCFSGWFSGWATQIDWPFRDERGGEGPARAADYFPPNWLFVTFGVEQSLQKAAMLRISLIRFQLLSPDNRRNAQWANHFISFSFHFLSCLLHVQGHETVIAILALFHWQAMQWKHSLIRPIEYVQQIDSLLLYWLVFGLITCGLKKNIIVLTQYLIISNYQNSLKI